MPCPPAEESGGGGPNALLCPWQEGFAASPFQLTRMRQPPLANSQAEIPRGDGGRKTEK